MFEILIKKDAYVGVINTSYAVTRGTICYKQGINTSGQILLNVPTSSVHAALAMYPVDKITMRDDLGDTSTAINQFSKGERCIYYEGGTFRTDVFVYSGSLVDYSTPTFPTDTALYTLKAGKFLNLYPSITAAQYGKLKDTSNGVFTSATSALRNRNFETLAIYNATPSAIITYRIRTSRIGSDQYWVGNTLTTFSG